MAAILLDNVGAERDNILHRRCSGLQRISDTHPAYDRLHFPLLFPHGEQCWHLAVRNQGDATSRNISRVSCREFAAFRLHEGQWVLIATSRCKIISARGFHANYRNVCA